LVSVIIATRNRLALLPRALQSVYAQDYPNLEILVLDDASDDGSSDYIRSCHPRVRSFRFERNRGPAAARNLLMREARGEYIVGIDDDACFLNTDAISKVIARVEREPQLAVAQFRVIQLGQEMTSRPDGECYLNTFSTCGHCLRKAVLRETGDYPSYVLRQGEEPDLAIRLLDHGYYIMYFPGAVVSHDISEQGRDFKLWHTLGPRNLLLRSWVNEPFPWYMLSTANSVFKCLIKGTRGGTLPYVLRGFGAAVKELPHVRSMRRPVSSKAMRVHFALRQKTVTEVTEIQKLYESPPTFLSILLSRGS